MERVALFFCMMALWMPISGARADEMPVVTGMCAVTAEKRQDPVSALVDGQVTTAFRWYRSTVVTVKPRTPVFGLYMKWNETPGQWQVRVQRGDEWVTVYTAGGDGLLHAFLPMVGLEMAFQILPVPGEALPPLAELILLGEGDVPAWVQRWEQPPEKAELMLVSAHCDDELVFMGGILPTYAGERRRETVVVYLSARSARRRHEALDGLWACGVTRYPVFGPFRDFRTESLTETYAMWGKDKTRAFVAELMRRFKPDVVVTHDLKGEYGHGAHKLAAAVVRDCVEMGDDEAFMPDSYAAWGGWQPYKCYLHLYAEDRLTLDFDVPLDRFGGRTAREVADGAFAHHASQQSIGYRAKDRGPYDCALWGLAFSLVGKDAAKDDLFEDVPRAAPAAADDGEAARERRGGF